MKSFSTLYILMLIKEMKKESKLWGFCYKRSRLALSGMFPFSGDSAEMTPTETLNAKTGLLTRNGSRSIWGMFGTRHVHCHHHIPPRRTYQEHQCPRTGEQRCCSSSRQQILHPPPFVLFRPSVGCKDAHLPW